MASERIIDQLNVQLNRELYSGYLYLSMCAYFNEKGLPGFAHWMRVQAQEELTHAMKFFDYITKSGGRVKLATIQVPPLEWQSVEEVFRETLAHEQKVTSYINQLVDLAIQEKDHATNNFLQWFVSEQVEEEENGRNILDRLRLVGEDKGSLFMLDRELAQRVFVPPAQER
ncbi:MAG: ferritin [Desulfatiglandales bacterium]